MAIRREYGKVSDIAKLAKLAGQSIQARREGERRQEMMFRAEEMQRREQLAQYEAESRMQREQMSMDWENQKLAMRSQHDFALEEMKQEAWAQRETAKQIKKADEYDMAKDKLQAAFAEGEINQSQFSQALVRLDLKFSGAAGVLPSAGKETDMMDDMLKRQRLLTGYTPPDKDWIWDDPATLRKGGVTRELTPEETKMYEDIRTGGTTQQTKKEPTPEELRAKGTKEAYETGIRLGYWK